MTYVLLDKEKELINALEGLQEGQKITLVGFNDFGFISVAQTKFHSLEVSENNYQRYIYMIHKPKNKRKLYKKSLEYKDIIILNGWIDIDTESQWNTSYSEDQKITESVYTSFDNTFIKEVALIWEKETLYSNIEL